MSTRRQRERALLAALVGVQLLLVAGIVVAIRGDRRMASAAAPGVDAATVSRLEIARAGRADIALERGADDDWHVVAPCALDANDARVEPLLGALGANALDYPAGEVDLEAAGLLEPLAVIRIDGVATRLGATDLAGDRRYALRGERVALVPEWTLSLVDGGLSALAEPVPFPEAPTDLRRVDEGGGERVDPAPWVGIAASQIVAWPVPDAPPTTRDTRFEATLASGEIRRLELVGNAHWNALRVEGQACAWLFADDDLPPDAYPEP